MVSKLVLSAASVAIRSGASIPLHIGFYIGLLGLLHDMAAEF